MSGCATPKTRFVDVSESAMRNEAEKQMDWAVRAIESEQRRLARVYWNLATRAHTLCGKDLASGIGAEFWSTSKSDLSSAYSRLFGITQRPTVLFTLEGSPAGIAGLQARDVLTHLNGIAIPNMERFEEIYRTLDPGALIHASVIRNGAPLALEIKPQIACGYSAVLSPDQVPNAFADGSRIVITRGMMAFARDDFDLSLVLAHELGHNAMHHMDAKRRNLVGNFFGQVLGAIMPGAENWARGFSSAGVNGYSREFEAEADYFGSYILAAAGLPLEGAADFWRRLAILNPSNIDPANSGSHSSIPYRALALQAAAGEIRYKIEHGQPLEPNMKDGNRLAAFSR